MLDDSGVREDADLVEIQLGHMCNNRCVFCSSGQATALGQARPMDAEPIFAAIDRAKARHARKVTFLGGEPTLQRAFLPALAHAQRLGFEEIEIFTNGVKAARRSWVDEVVALGKFSWRFSVQGGNEEAHDLATVKPGAFARITAGMENVRACGQRITANACINELSYRSLPDYVELVQRYGIEQLHLDVVRPASAGERTDGYLGDIIPRHAEMAPYFARMLELFEAWDPDYDVNVGNVPLCLLPQWANKVHHGGQPTLTLASDGDNALSAKDKYTVQHSDKRHGPGCAKCVFRPDCSGVFETYARLHGIEELQPVTPQRLAELDPMQRAFARGVEPHLGWLLADPMPSGWSVDAVHHAPRDRRVTIDLAYDGRSAVRLRAQPANAEVGSALISTDRYRLRWVGGGDAPLEAVAELGGFLGERAASDPDATSVAPNEIAAWVAAAMDPRRLAKSLSVLATALPELERNNVWPSGIAFAGQAPLSDWPGVRLVLKIGGKELGFALRAREAGALLDVRLEPNDVAASMRRACADALRRALSPLP